MKQFRNCLEAEKLLTINSSGRLPAPLNSNVGLLMGFELFLVPFALFGGLATVALLAFVIIARGRTWWITPLLVGVPYSTYESYINSDLGWNWLFFFASIGILYVAQAFLFVIGALALLPFKARLSSVLNRFFPRNVISSGKE